MATVTIEPVAWRVTDAFGNVTFGADLAYLRKNWSRTSAVIKPLFTAEALAQARAEGKAEGTRDGVRVKALEWTNGEVRSALGDLYSVHHLSENVWSTRKNGTAFTGWETTEGKAKAVAQADLERCILPALALPSPPADGEVKPPMDSEALFDWLQEHYKSVGVTPALREAYRRYRQAKADGETKL